MSACVSSTHTASYIGQSNKLTDHYSHLNFLQLTIPNCNFLARFIKFIRGDRQDHLIFGATFEIPAIDAVPLEVNLKHGAYKWRANYSCKEWFYYFTLRKKWGSIKSIPVTWRLQTIFNATFVAARCCTTLNRLQIPTTLLQ